MSLLEFSHVSKRYGDCVALHDVSLTIEAGELVVVWGRRRSGRSTLLRVAAGLHAPDEGVVLVRGRGSTAPCFGTLNAEVRFCRKTFGRTDGPRVLDQMVQGPLLQGIPAASAQARALAALRRVGAQHTGRKRPGELDTTEAVLVSIARALVGDPQVLVIDEPTLGVDLRERDRILLLLREIANDGVAILASAGETPCMSGADRALTISDGELHGDLDAAAALAPVVPLRPAASA